MSYYYYCYYYVFFLAGGFWEARGTSSLDCVDAAPQCQSDTHANEALA